MSGCGCCGCCGEYGEKRKSALDDIAKPQYVDHKLQEVRATTMHLSWKRSRIYLRVYTLEALAPLYSTLQHNGTGPYYFEPAEFLNSVSQAPRSTSHINASCLAIWARIMSKSEIGNLKVVS